MRPPGGILAPGESLIATGELFFLDLPSASFLISCAPPTSYAFWFGFLVLIHSFYLIINMLKHDILDSDTLL